MRTIITRDFYIPTNSEMVQVSNDIVVYKYLSALNDSLPAAVCFVGKTIKPTWKFYFETEEAREQEIKKTVDKINKRNIEKIKRDNLKKANKELAVASVNVGDIFVESFSFEYTTIEFYQVIDKKNSRITLAKITKNIVDAEECERNEYYTPNKDDFDEGALDNTIVKTIQRISDDKRVYLSGWSTYNHFKSWSGKPVYQTNCNWR